MKQIFLVPGYGVPKDITRDGNYGRYLGLVFNKIYDLAAEKEARIIFSGGPTDCFKPYRRTEAGEMLKMFKRQVGASFLKKATARWCLAEERKAISTLENLLNAKKFFRNNKAAVFVFCEETRQDRVRKLVKKIFGRLPVKIVPVDFDASANRYRGDNYLSEKETLALKVDLWGLKSRKNLHKHHLAHEERLAILRRAPENKRGEALNEWWKKWMTVIK